MRPRFIRPDEEAIAAATILVPARVPIAGVNLRQQGVNVYRCPVCSNVFRHDDEYEPVCTGPGALDSHTPAVMVLERVDRQKPGIILLR